MTVKQGFAGYVAIEKVTGTLARKTGTFMLQHFGIMRGEESRLILEVIPDSATGELTGLSGSIAVERKGNDHHYVFTYEW